MRTAHPARPLALCLLLAVAGCDDGDGVDVVHDANGPDAEVPAGFGCFETGPWSSATYEGDPYISESMYGTVDDRQVGRAQQIRLRLGHVFSIDSYSTDLLGLAAASSWMWHARCASGSDYYSDWQTITTDVFYASGCGEGEATYLRVRVRAANC